MFFKASITPNLISLQPISFKSFQKLDGVFSILKPSLIYVFHDEKCFKKSMESTNFKYQVLNFAKQVQLRGMHGLGG